MTMVSFLLFDDQLFYKKYVSILFWWKEQSWLGGWVTTIDDQWPLDGFSICPVWGKREGSNAWEGANVGSILWHVL